MGLDSGVGGVGKALTPTNSVSLEWEIWEKCKIFGQILLILNQKLIL